MLRGFVIVGLIMFSVSVLSVYAETCKDSFDVDTFNERWKPCVSVAGNPASDWKIEDGVLKGHWTINGLQLLLMEYPSLDYTIQVKCRIDNGNNAEGGGGIAFRSMGPGQPGNWQNTANFYMFSIHRTGFRLHRIGAGWWDSPVAEGTLDNAKEHGKDEWYMLKLEARGDSLKGYANDELIFDVQDGAFNGGYVGLFTGMFTDASFDDFIITNQWDSLAQDNASVSPEETIKTTWSRLKKQ